MSAPKKVLVVALLSVGIIPAASVAEGIATHGTCARTFTLAEFQRATGAVYQGTGLPPKGSYGHLWRYARCQRPPSSEATARRSWATSLANWKARRHPPLPYGEWAIPPSIVMCESQGQNLPPNSAGASGYYQIIPSTWQAYGGSRYASEAYLSSKEGQDVVAGRIWDGGNGAGQWVCKE